MPTTPISPDGSSVADERAVVTIDIDDEVDRWRYLCPNGHRNWSPTDGGIYCQSCQRDHAVDDPQYRRIRDARTGQIHHWADVELV